MQVAAAHLHTKQLSLSRLLPQKEPVFFQFLLEILISMSCSRLHALEAELRSFHPQTGAYLPGILPHRTSSEVDDIIKRFSSLLSLLPSPPLLPPSPHSEMVFFLLDIKALEDFSRLWGSSFPQDLRFF